MIVGAYPLLTRHDRGVAENDAITAAAKSVNHTAGQAGGALDGAAG